MVELLFDPFPLALLLPFMETAFHDTRHRKNLLIGHQLPVKGPSRAQVPVSIQGRIDLAASSNDFGYRV